MATHFTSIVGYLKFDLFHFGYAMLQHLWYRGKLSDEDRKIHFAGQFINTCTLYCIANCISQMHDLLMAIYSFQCHSRA